MPALDNPRWEKFCEHIIWGATQVQAYQLAFGTDNPNGSSSLASRLMDKPEVLNRLTELRTLTATGGKMLSLARKRAFLSEIVETAPGAIDENNPLCQSFKRKIRTEKDGTKEETIEYELPNKLKALELDARLAGELNGSPMSLRISMFAPGQAIDVAAEFVADSQGAEISMPPGEHQSGAEVAE